MLQRSLLSGPSLGFAILLLCPNTPAQETVKKDTQESAQASSSPAIREEQIYRQTKEMLAFFERDLVQREKRIADKLVGRVCDQRNWGCDPPGKVTQRNVAEALKDCLAGVRREQKYVESEHQRLSKEKPASLCVEDCKIYYQTAVDGAASYWQGMSWLTIAMQVLTESTSRLNNQLEDVRNKLQEKLGKENASPERNAAELAELFRKQSKVRETDFDNVAYEFQGYVRLLRDDRKNLVVRLWQMYDIAEANHYEDGKEIIMEALKSWDKKTFEMNGQLYFGFFHDVTDKPIYAWCQKRSYPEIESPDSKNPCDTLLTDVMPQESIKSLHGKATPKPTVQATECKLRLTYVPRVLTVTALQARPNLEYVPQGCTRPEPQAVAEYSLAPTSDEDAIRLVNKQDGRVEWGKPGTATIVVRVGSLDTFVTIQAKEGPCQNITMAGLKDKPVRAGLMPELGAGESGEMELDYAPPGCTVPEGDLHVTSDKPEILQVDSVSERAVTVTALSRGVASLKAVQAAKPDSAEGIQGKRSIFVMAPRCSELRLIYPSSTVKTDTYDPQVPALQFLPEGCIEPRDKAKYKLVKPTDHPYNLYFDPTTGSFRPPGAPGDVTVDVAVGGKLTASATIKVEPGHCRDLILELANKRTLKFGNSEFPSVILGDTAQLLVVAYEPKGCSLTLPTAPLDLKSDDPKVLVVDPHASDVLIALKLGHTTIRASQGDPGPDFRHGILAIYVVPREECTQWILTILPASIIVGETAEVRLTGEPDGCFDPKWYSLTGYEIENRETASGGGDSDKITGVAKITGRAEGTTKIYSKPFPAVTTLTVKPQPTCEKLEVHYSGNVEVGGVSLEPVVTYSPEHCKAPDPERVKKWFSGSPDEHAQVNFLTGAVTGIAPGKFEVIVNQEGVKQPGTTTLQVTPPWCTNLQVIYSPKSIHLPSEAASPTRHYSPYGCTPPSAAIEYALDPKDRDDDIATIDPATGVLKGKKARTAHVTVSQGQLSTSTSVEILPPH